MVEFENNREAIMTKIRAYGVVLAVIMVAGCATKYAPSQTLGGFEFGGYTDKRIDQNTVIVSFDGNSATSPQKVWSYLLYRAATVTLNSGFDYFIVTSTSKSTMNVAVKEKTRHYPITPPKPYNQTYRDIQYAGYQTERSFMRCSDGGEPPCQYPHNAVAVIKMYKGQKPSGTPRAYSAADVIAQYGPSTFD